MYSSIVQAADFSPPTSAQRKLSYYRTRFSSNWYLCWPDRSRLVLFLEGTLFRLQWLSFWTQVLFWASWPRIRLHSSDGVHYGARHRFILLSFYVWRSVALALRLRKKIRVSFWNFTRARESFFEARWPLDHALKAKREPLLCLDLVGYSWVSKLNKVITLSRIAIVSLSAAVSASCILLMGSRSIPSPLFLNASISAFRILISDRSFSV